MSVTNQVKRGAMRKSLDYFLENPEAHAQKIMDMIDAVVPEKVFNSQRQAFRDALASKNNWYQLIMRITEMNPEVRDDLIKNFVVDGNLLAWPKQEDMRIKHQCNIPWAILLDRVGVHPIFCCKRKEKSCRN